MFIFTNSHNLLIPLCSISFETNAYFPRKQNIPLKTVNQALQDLNVRIELSSFNRTFCYSIAHFIVVNIMQNIFDRLLLNLKKNSPLVYLQKRTKAYKGGRGFKIAEFRAYVLFEWPPSLSRLKHMACHVSHTSPITA